MIIIKGIEGARSDKNKLSTVVHDAINDDGTKKAGRLVDDENTHASSAHEALYVSHICTPNQLLLTVPLDKLGVV
jgi:hypothetical protein